MKKITIENVQVGVAGGGGCCGIENVVAEAQVRIGDKVSFYGLVEVTGIPCFYELEQSRYDKEMNGDFEEVVEPSEDFDDYIDFYRQFEDLSKEDEAHALLIKYLIYLVRADWEEIDAMKKISIGKDIGEFEIPVCDVEEEYLEECDDEY